MFMELNKEGIYLTFLFYQLLMVASIWMKVLENEKVKQFNKKRIKLTLSFLVSLLLTVGGYFIQSHSIIIEWMVGLIIFGFMMFLTFRLENMINDNNHK